MSGEITYTLTADDYIRAAQSQYWNRLRSPKRWALALAIVLTPASIFAYLESCGWFSFVANLIPYLLIFLVLCPLLAASSYIWCGRYARRLFRQQKVATENRLAWNEDGLQIESALGSLTAKWNDFHAWTKSAHAYMIYLNDALYYLVPKHSLSPAEDADFEGTLGRSGVAKR